MIVITTDILSIIIMALFFSKLTELNERYLNIIDGMNVKMSEFTIKCDNVLLDKYSQDPRLFKLKLWYHLSEKLLIGDRKIENKNEIKKDTEGTKQRGNGRAHARTRTTRTRVRTHPHTQFFPSYALCGRRH